MEVRCSSCNKLFRVSDDKISGSGIKFSCTRCGNTVRITRQNFEQYSLSRAAESALASSGAGRSGPGPVSTVPAPAPAATASGDSMADFDLSDPATAAAALQPGQERDPASGALPADDRPDFDLGEPLPHPEDVRKEQKKGQPGPDAASQFFAPPVEEPDQPGASAPHVLDFDLTEPSTEETPTARQEEKPPVFTKPVPVPASRPAAAAAPEKKQPARESGPKPKPAAPASQPKVEAAVSPVQKHEPVAAAALSAAPAPAVPREDPATAASIWDSVPRKTAGGGAGKKLAIAFLLLLIAAGAWFGVGVFRDRMARSSAAARVITSPDGLNIRNASGVIDPANNDLVISGAIENTTDAAKPAWYLVVDVFDAQGNVLVKGRMLSGKPFYTRRDFGILAARGQNIRDIMAKNLQEPGVIIPARGSVNFEVRIMEPPVGIANFNPSLQPFDPVQLFKEMAEEQK